MWGGWFGLGQFKVTSCHLPIKPSARVAEGFVHALGTHRNLVIIGDGIMMQYQVC